MMRPATEKDKGRNNHDVGKHTNIEQYPGHDMKNDHKEKGNPPRWFEQ